MYFFQLSRYFIDERSLNEHFRTKLHKRRFVSICHHLISFISLICINKLIKLKNEGIRNRTSESRRIK